MASAIIAESLIIILEHVTRKEEGVGLGTVPRATATTGVEPFETEVAGHACASPLVQAVGECQGG